MSLLLSEFYPLFFPCSVHKSILRRRKRSEDLTSRATDCSRQSWAPGRLPSLCAQPMPALLFVPRSAQNPANLFYSTYLTKFVFSHFWLNRVSLGNVSLKFRYYCPFTLQFDISILEDPFASHRQGQQQDKAAEKTSLLGGVIPHTLHTPK